METNCGKGIWTTEIAMKMSPITLPRLGIGRFEVGHVETMVDSGKNDDTGILLTIYYPADSTFTCVR
uniref:Uncharacterized protein n=1 Tax=Onchocerca volvulus TaxID=6282 RepID=A0A8R1XS88_ONCVO